MNATQLAEKQKLIDEITTKLVDEGKLIEAGFAALRVMCIAQNAPEAQVSDMRMAFMAGAQHLFSSIMNILEPGKEPTEKDMHRMQLISEELEKIVTEMNIRMAPKG